MGKATVDEEVVTIKGQLATVYPESLAEEQKTWILALTEQAEDRSEQ